MYTFESKTNTLTSPRKSPRHFFQGQQAGRGAFFSRHPIQAKLTIGKPNDIYEKQADAMPGRAVRMLQEVPKVQKDCPEYGKKKGLQMKLDLRRRRRQNSPPSIQRKVGFEFELNYSGESRKPPRRGPLGLRSTAVGDIRPVIDHFKVEMDGSRLELTTKPFEETPAGRGELVTCLDSIVALGNDLKSRCQGVKRRRGRPRWFTPPAGFDASEVESLYPIGRKPFYRQSCGVSASPQATLGIRLDKFGKLVRKMKKSEGSSIPLSGSRKTRGGRRRRLGLRSTILYEARTKVMNSRKRELRNSALPNGKALDQSNFSIALANFMALLVSYLRTSVRLDSADYEGYAKAYPPIVTHSDFTKIYQQLLSPAEREVFFELYGKVGARRKLFKLASYQGKGDGNTEMFPPKVASGITWNDVVDKLLAGTTLHTKLTPNAKEYGPEQVGPSGAGKKGMVVEMRRLGYTWRSVKVWKRLALKIYDMVKKLNAEP